MKPIFITGIGTGIGKTLVSAIVARALDASYWKPIQAGIEESTDKQLVEALTGDLNLLPEAYRLALPASPHIAAAQEGITIRKEELMAAFRKLRVPGLLVVEGAGGLMVPLSSDYFVLDLIEDLDAAVILVSRNYLGSINHSLLTAEACKARGLDVRGWIFNDQYMSYEEEIVKWSGFRSLGSIPYTEAVNSNFVAAQSARLKPALLAHCS